MTAFDGDFEILPARAMLDHGPIPTHPTDAERIAAEDEAQMADPFTWGGASSVWWAEAIRFRRLYPGRKIDHVLGLLAEITAERLARLQRQELAS